MNNNKELYLKRKKEEFKNNIIKFYNDLNDKDINIYHSVSFDFDYIAIDYYQNFSDGTFKVRVCLDDSTLENILM